METKKIHKYFEVDRRGIFCTHPLAKFAKMDEWRPVFSEKGEAERFCRYCLVCENEVDINSFGRCTSCDGKAVSDRSYPDYLETMFGLSYHCDTRSWSAYCISHGRKFGYPVRPEVEKFADKLGWWKRPRFARNTHAFVKTIRGSLNEVLGGIIQILEEKKRLDDYVEVTEKSYMYKEFEGKNVYTYDKGDTRRKYDSHSPEGWGKIGTWNTGGGGHIQILYARAGAPLEEIRDALTSFRGHNGDEVSVENGNLVIRTYSKGLWIGARGWRIEGLKIATKRRIRIIQK